MNVLPVFDHKKFAGQIIAALLSGCASIPDNLATNGTLEADRIDSRNAYIRHVYVRPVDSELKIRGSIRKKFHGRSPIPGHLHIEVFGHNDEVLIRTTSRYLLANGKSRPFHFSETVPVQSSKATKVRLVLHAGYDNHD